MSTEIITKTCFKCKQEKPVSEFYKYKSRNNSCFSSCKTCYNAHAVAYHKTEIGKKAQAKWKNSEAGKLYMKEYIKKYRKTEKGIEVTKTAAIKYNNTKKGRIKIHRDRKKYRANHPQKIIAHNKIGNAVHYGHIPPSNTQICNVCGEKAEHYHHNDYSRPFEVIPLCRNCHVTIHYGS